MIVFINVYVSFGLHKGSKYTESDAFIKLLGGIAKSDYYFCEFL